MSPMLSVSLPMGGGDCLLPWVLDGLVIAFTNRERQKGHYVTSKTGSEKAR